MKRLNQYQISFTVEGHTRPGRKPDDEPVPIVYKRTWLDKSRGVITQDRIQERYRNEYGGGKITLTGVVCTENRR